MFREMIPGINIPAFIAGTVVIIVFSWYYSLRAGRNHGIPRFFSFESIYLLLLLNADGWFSDPFSPHQIVSWILLILSAWAGLAGFITLRRRGMAEGGFENTTRLVTSGIYSVIRHPLYLSLFLLGTGSMFKNPGLPAVILAIVNFAAVFLTGLTEEKEMIKKFGADYKDYMKGTKMFIPFII